MKTGGRPALCSLAWSILCHVWSQHVRSNAVNQFAQDLHSSNQMSLRSVSVSLAFFPAPGGRDVLSASEGLGWCLLRLDDTKSYITPFHPASRCNVACSWAIFHQRRQLHCRSLGARTAVGSGSFSAFPLLERSRGVLPRESFAEQLGNCNGTWSNPSIFLVLSSRRAQNLESWLRSIWQNEKSLPELVWQGLAQRVYSWNNCVFAKSKKLKYTCLCATIWPFLGESSWLDKMQNVTAHLNCWNGWKREIQSWCRNPSWHRRPIFRHISEFGFSTRVNFSTGANFSVSMQICWKVTASILPVYCSMLSWRCVFAHDKTSLLQKWAHCGILSGHGLICLYVIYVTCLRNNVQTCSFLHPWLQQAWGFRAAFC